MKIKADRVTVIQFIKFSFVGLTNCIVMLSVYYVILWINPEWYLIGNIMGWIVSVVNAYVWNQRFTFKGESLTRSEALRKLGKSYLSYGATFCLSTFLLWLEVDIMGWSALLCPVINILITTPFNFVLNKFYTFR